MQKGRKIMHFLLFMISHMKPLPGDLVVWGKRGLDAFPGTNLSSLLVRGEGWNRGSP